MTLNDNPRVSAERRRKLLLIRRQRLISYKSQRLEIMNVSQIIINPYVKARKASALIGIINKELSEIDNFLKHF